MGEVSDGRTGSKREEIFTKPAEAIMKCPHLIKRLIVSCKAFDAPYVPSLFEIQEYCRTKDHRKCPFYLRDIIGRNTTETRLSV
jgi:hypothetical protein